MCIGGSISGMEPRTSSSRATVSAMVDGRGEWPARTSSVSTETSTSASFSVKVREREIGDIRTTAERCARSAVRMMSACSASSAARARLRWLTENVAARIEAPRRPAAMSQIRFWPGVSRPRLMTVSLASGPSPASCFWIANSMIGPRQTSLPSTISTVPTVAPGAFPAPERGVWRSGCLRRWYQGVSDTAWRRSDRGTRR